MDYAEGIIEYFVDLRGKGATVSSLDQQTVLAWEVAGVPLAAVLDGIDDAFTRKAEPPKSIRDCKRWVTKQAKTQAARQGTAPTARDAAAAAVARAIDAGGWDPAAADQSATSPAEVARAWLDALARSHDARLQRAVASLTAEVEQVIAQEGALPEAMLDVLDDALAALLLGELGAEVSAGIRVRSAAEANRAREAGLDERAVEARRRRVIREEVGGHVPWRLVGES